MWCGASSVSTVVMDNTHSKHRWAAIGAAVAVSLGAGGLGIAGAASPAGAAAYVAISPCRLLDTRPDSQFHIGSHTTLGPETRLTAQAWGNQGLCSLPAGTTGLELNVTATDAAAPTYLTLYPGAGDPPNASHLNPAPGQPPVPNAVTVALDPTGTFTIFNKNGTVDVIVDVVGYYADHHHDDRYPTRPEVDAALAAKAARQQELTIPASAFVPENAATQYTITRLTGAHITDGGTTLRAPLVLPAGATVTALTYFVQDGSTYFDLTTYVDVFSLDTIGVHAVCVATTSGTPALASPTCTGDLPLVIAPNATYSIAATSNDWPQADDGLKIRGARVQYTLPA